jgi:hypothetical protein
MSRSGRIPENAKKAKRIQKRCRLLRAVENGGAGRPNLVALGK